MPVIAGTSSPSPEELSKLANAEASALEAVPTKRATDEQVEALKKKATQTHGFRDSFFRTVKWSLISTLAAAVVIMGLYIVSEWSELESAVLISFNAAVVVNTIGLAYIVANYLFPKGGGD